MRVLQVLGSLDRGGAETMIMNIYREIDRSKVQFDFVLHTDRKCAYTDEVLSMGGRIYTVPKYTGTNTLSYIRAWNRLFKNHKEYKIVHSHIRSTAAIFLFIARKYGIYTIIHSHSTSSGQGMIAFIKNMLQLPIRFIANSFFSCSALSAKWLFGKRIVASDRYEMIPNAIDLKKYIFDEKVREKCRNEWHADGKIVFGNVGRFNRVKNHEFLLEIFSEIYNTNKDTILVLVGDGELRGEIEEKAKKLGIYESVILTGMREDINRILQGFDCFLFPSLWEGLPVAVVEAQAAGLPCYLSDTITKEVDLSELVHYLPIDRGAKVWVDKILKSDLQRKDVIDKIKKAGFDIKETASYIQNYYEEVYRGCNEK